MRSLIKTIVLVVTIFSLLGCGGAELNPRWVEKLEIVVPANDLFLGETVAIAAKATYNDAKVEDVTHSAVWSIDNTEFVQLSDTNIKALKVGSSVLSATFNSRIRNVTITVKTLPEAIEINEVPHFVKENTTLALTANTVVKDQKTPITDNLVWRSSNENAATVAPDGLVTGKHYGRSEITVSRANLTTTAFVVYVFPDVQNLELVLDQPQLNVDDTVYPKAIATYTDGSTEDVTYHVLWQSSKPTVAVIGKGGAIFAAGEGTAKISATLFDSAVSVDVRIAPKMVPFVEKDTEGSIVLRWHSQVPNSYNIYWSDSPNVDKTSTKVSDITFQNSVKNINTGVVTYVYKYAFDQLAPRKRYYFRLSMNAEKDGQSAETHLGRVLPVVVRDNRWELVSGHVVPPINSASAADENAAYFIGGEIPSPVKDKLPSASPIVTKFQWIDGALVESSVPNMNVARSAAAAVNVGGDIYVLGGRIFADGGDTTSADKYVNIASVEVLRAATGRWELLPSMPTARSFLVAEAVGDTIYVIGGEGGNQTMEAFNTVTNEWVKLTKPPSTVAKSASAVVNGLIYVFGVGAGQDAIRYNPVVDYWQALPTSPHVHVSASAKAINGKIYIVGGDEKNPLLRVDVYETGLNHWMSAPDMLETSPIIHSQLINDSLMTFYGASDKTIDTGYVHIFR